jgi:broad-specificity NMP kinase
MAARSVAIGGSSSVGKTTTARTLAREDGYRHVEVDRTWTEHPGRELANKSVLRLPPQALCEKLVEKARVLQPQIVRWIVEQTDGRVVLEGEGFEPSIVDELDPALDVKVVFIVELDPERLRATLEGRSKSFHALEEHERVAVVAMGALYNRRIFEQAKAHGQPWLLSQPWETLPARVRALIQ